MFRVDGKLRVSQSELYAWRPVTLHLSRVMTVLVCAGVLASP